MQNGSIESFNRGDPEAARRLGLGTASGTNALIRTGSVASTRPAK